jgi:hypothetical protein
VQKILSSRIILKIPTRDRNSLLIFNSDLGAQ